MKSGKSRAIIGGIIASVIIAVVAVSMNTNIFDQSKTPKNSVANITGVTSKIKVAASFFPLYEFAKNMGGDKAEVYSFLPIGNEPHSWEPSIQQIEELKGTQLFIYNGAGMEAYISKFMSSGEFSNMTFVKATEGITLLKADSAEHDKEILAQGGMDPHVWNDPVLAEQEVTNIKNAMKKADPTNAQYYEDNANAYIAKLAALDNSIKSGLSNCKKDTFVSFHNAFNYFSNRYGVHDVWITGIAPEADVPPQDIQKVIQIAKDKDVKVIFSEDLVDPRLANTLANEIGAQVLVLSPLEGINQTEQQKGITYLDKWNQNLHNLRTALECQ
ncbi:MAG TPA: zinc ABC transporter substrate-binding protein [Nitrosopumilaceae archaeon]|nr:zinc ABC transporter substrate-binding protein [Nitrosopumilaceae archaeon]